MELSFISFEEQGKKATKRKQRQHVIRRQMFLKVKGISNSGRVKNTKASWNLTVSQLNDSKFKSDLEAQFKKHVHFVERQSFRPMAPPDLFRWSEVLIFTMHHHVSNRVEERLLPSTDPPSPELPDIARRRRLPTPHCSSELHYSMEQGLEFLKSGHTARAIASFERSFRAIRDVILTDHFAVMLESCFVVTHAYCLGFPEVGAMMLRQVNAMANQVFGPQHPYAIWTNAFLRVWGSDTFLETADKAAHALADAVESVLGPHDIVTLKIRTKAYLVSAIARGKDPRLGDISEIFTLYRNTLSEYTEERLGQDWVFLLCNSLTNLCDMMMEFGLYNTAKELLVGTDDLFTKSIETVRQTQNPLLLDQSINAVYSYGRVLLHCGEFLDCQRVLMQGVAASIEFFGPGSIHAANGYNQLQELFVSTGLTEEFRIIQQRLDDALSPYSLSEIKI